MKMNHVRWVLSLAAVAAWGGVTRAQLTITPAGQAQGLSLSTFATGFPNNADGPLGIAFPSPGGVLVTDVNGNIYLFPTDTDGQNAATTPVTQNYGANNAIGLAQVGGGIYMTRQGIGDLVQVNNNGTFNQVIATGMPSATGITADPFNGHVFVSTIGSGVVFDVDPIAKTKSVFANVAADGLSLSLDGKTLYAEVNSHILGFDTTTKAQVFDSGAIPGSADGTAVGAGPFAGFIFANTNSGQLFEINLTTMAQTLIATGGSRGDFVTVDPATNTLLITQTDRIQRLNGASFVVPEPSSIALIGIGLAGLAVARLRRKPAR